MADKWDKSTDYSALSIVAHRSAVWVATKRSKGIEPSSGMYWQPVATKGERNKKDIFAEPVVEPEPITRSEIFEFTTIVGQPVIDLGDVVDWANALDRPNVIGLCSTSAVNGRPGEIVTSGKLELENWAWALDEAIHDGPVYEQLLTPGDTYYLAKAIGRITNIEPTIGYLVQVGTARTKTILDVSIAEPQFLGTA